MMKQSHGRNIATVQNNVMRLSTKITMNSMEFRKLPQLKIQANKLITGNSSISSDILF